MLNNLTVLYDRWFRHPQYGIDAMIDLVPRARPPVNGEAQPDLPRPSVTIYNDVEHESVVKNIDPTEVPALVIFTDADSNVPLHPNRRASDRRVTTTIAYVTREMVPLEAVAAGDIVLRAGKMVLRHFNDQRASKGYRELNGVKIMEIRSVTEQRVSGAVGRSQLWGFLLSDATVLDTTL